jgi:cytochrome d ubiquinol oxidase subunit I
MNTAGWLLTENGRQPWIVQGLMKTANANSPSVTQTDIWISLSAFVLVFLFLGAVDLVLMLRYARKGIGDQGSGDPGAAAVPAMSY